jgi:hypothetical protein
MRLFKRKSATRAFVMTAKGWVLFTEAVAAHWQDIAAKAWEGYLSSGRGFVSMGFNPQHMDYRTIEDAKRWLDSGSRVAEFQREISRYKPDREVLMLVQGWATNKQEASAEESFTQFLYVRTPKGLPGPPAASKHLRLMEAVRVTLEVRNLWEEAGHD